MPCYDDPAYSNSFDVFIRGKSAILRKDIISTKMNVKRYGCLMTSFCDFIVVPLITLFANYLLLFMISVKFCEIFFFFLLNGSSVRSLLYTFIYLFILNGNGNLNLQPRGCKTEHLWTVLLALYHMQLCFTQITFNYGMALWHIFLVLAYLHYFPRVCINIILMFLFVNIIRHVCCSCCCYSLLTKLMKCTLVFDTTILLDPIG